MKIALTCDHLLADDPYTRCLSSLLEIFPHAHLYTLAHRRSGAPPPLRERTIHASYISHKIATPRHLAAHAWAAPRAAEHLTIPCDTDLVFSFSAGLGHGIKKCKKTRQIVYLYRDYTPPKGLIPALFAPYVQSWSRRKLAESEQLWIARSGLGELAETHHSHPRLLRPGLPVECFLRPVPLARPTFHAVEPPISPPLAHILEKSGHPWKPLQSPQTLKDSHALIAPHPTDQFPERIFKALALGNPVIIRDNPLNRELFQSLENRGVAFIAELSRLPAALKECPFPTDPGPLRSLALQYSESRFKSNVRKMLKQYLDSPKFDRLEHQGLIPCHWRKNGNS